MNRKIEAKLPRALGAVREYLLADKGNLIAFKEYDGYAANLGASIRQSGLLPALSFFTDVHKMKDDSSKPYRNILLSAILFTLDQKLPEKKTDRGRELLRRVILDCYGGNAFDGSGGVIRVGRPNNPESLKKWREDITVASVALKLALRSFRHTDKEVAEN